MYYLREIYKRVVEDSKYMDAAIKTIEVEAEKSLESYWEDTAIKDYEKIRDILFSVATIAEEESFLVGFQYAVSLMSDISIYKKELE